jgi:antitoxin (DNA-binding transcriptional repressor) of toxin-antitoxin stability system
VSIATPKRRSAESEGARPGDGSSQSSPSCEPEAGERIVIARAGKPVAILTAYRSATRKRRLGLFAGQARMHDDFDNLPSDLRDMFEGGS